MAGQITRECVYLVRRSHFQSRHKVGGHTIRSTIAENPVLHPNFTALSSIEPDLLDIEVLHCGNRSLAPQICLAHVFAPVTLTLTR